MEYLINNGFSLIETIKGDKNGYPNDVIIYHRVLKSGVAYQEVRIDNVADRCAFENSYGNLAVFKIWLGIRQAQEDNMQTKYYK